MKPFYLTGVAGTRDNTSAEDREGDGGSMAADATLGRGSGI